MPPVTGWAALTVHQRPLPAGAPSRWTRPHPVSSV